MAGSFISSALDALTTKKGAAIAGAAMLGLALLVNAGRSESGSAPRAPAQTLVLAQATPGSQSSAADAKGAFDARQTSAIQSIVRDYLLKNPELIVEMSKELEERERVRTEAAQSKLLETNKAKIFKSANDYVLNPDGDITVVEFFDYNCGWCKRALDDVNRLAKADPKVRVVMKEFPIFGADSIGAAKAAMASMKQGKYWEFHQALMRVNKITAANLFTIAKSVGLDVDRLRKDMQDPAYEKMLSETSAIAQALKIEGTPAFIVDGRVNVGYLTTDALRAQIAEARKAGCKMC